MPYMRPRSFLPLLGDFYKRNEQLQFLFQINDKKEKRLTIEHVEKNKEELRKIIEGVDGWCGIGERLQELKQRKKSGFLSPLELEQVKMRSSRYLWDQRRW
jgi:hypothetical protein